MELQQYLTILRERWGTAVLVALLVLTAVTAFTLTRTPIYTATNRVFVQTEAGDSVSERSSGANFASQQIITYADLAKTPLVLEPVIEELELDLTPGELAERISTEIPEDTLLINITAWSGDPHLSAELADATSESLQDQVAQLEAPSAAPPLAGAPLVGVPTDIDPGATSSTVELTVVSPATVPSSASSPNITRNLAVGAVLALVAAVAAAVIRDFLDNRVRRSSDVEALFERPVVGTIPAARFPESLPLIAAGQPQSIQAEAYRELRTNLHFMLRARHMNTVVVTSSILGEGKSNTATNLAHALAQAGSRVLLIDADLRRPALATLLRLESTAGLTTVLIGEAELDDVSQPLDTEGLDVLTSGPIPPNPSELLGGEGMKSLLEAAAARYDHVVLDTAPLLAVTDAVVLSSFVDGALVVAQHDRVKKQQLGGALAKLLSVDAHVLGVVINRAPRRSRETYTYTADESLPEPAGTTPAAVHDADPLPQTAVSDPPEPRTLHRSAPIPSRADAAAPATRSRRAIRRSARPEGSPTRERRVSEEQMPSLSVSAPDHHDSRSR